MHDNIIKLKPPMVFSEANARHLARHLAECFAEVEAEAAAA